MAAVHPSSSPPPLTNNFEESDDEEELCPEEEIKHRLKHTLDCIESAGLFAYHEQLKDAPNPGLHIEGAGTLAFPLSERDIQTIITASGQPPLQDGTHSENTLPPVRNVWEVSAEKLRLNNCSWRKLQQNILDTILDQLGISHEKGAELMEPTLILYQPGSVVKPCPA